MKRLLPACLLVCTLPLAVLPATVWTESFEGSFPPAGWITNSVDQSTTYAFSGSYSARLNATADYLITPPVIHAQTLLFRSYTTAADPVIIVEYAATPSGPWTETAESPFSGDTEQWNERGITNPSTNNTYFRFRKTGTGTLYLDEVSAEDGLAASNAAPVLNAVGNKSVTISNAIHFLVTASNADHDLISLSAGNLPPGAVFNSVTNTGSVTGLFSWAVAAPAGAYTTTFYAADGTTNGSETITISVTPSPAVPLTGAAWTVVYNLPQQSGSATDYPDQFRIRNALVARINALQAGHSAILTTFTFSADEGAGTILNALDAALDRGALIRFIADGDISLGTGYGGTRSLLSLSLRSSNPLTLAVDGSSSGIMHDKLGLFDYGGTNQWVFVASWNFTQAASANQWNIAIEARSPSLYSIYAAEAAEFLAGRFHDDPAKSHAHDGAPFTLDGSWGANFVRFAPYPDAAQGGNHAERDITNLMAQAQSGIVFALNKLNRTPIRNALIAAANRGVIVQGVLPKSDTGPGGVSAAVYSYLTNSASYTTTNIVHFLPAYAKADYSALDHGESDLIHAKYMVIDPDSTNAIVIHGSANWTYEALVSNNDNDENTVFLRHNEIAAKFYEDFQRITGSGIFEAGNSVLVEWNFSDSNVMADGGTAANISRTVRRIPAPSPTNFISGALSVTGWDGGANTKYWETDFSSLQHTNLNVSSKQTSTTTGPVHFQLQYKTGTSGAYTDVTNGTITVGTGWGGQLTRLPLPADCDNQTNVFLRWLMTSNLAVNGGAAGSSGASRMDDLIVTGTAYGQPPALASIGNKELFEGLSLSFRIAASDPIDGDPVTLSATNLPTGAVFTNGLFIWNTAAPAGAYAVTFYATDKDGSDSETVTITVSPRPQLFISEIADPSGTGGDVYRFVELYNAGTNAIALASTGWTLSRQNNGGTTWSDIPLTGTVASAGVYLIAKSRDDFFTAYGFYPQQESTGVDGNGMDAYFLFQSGTHTNGVLIDVYGQKDTDGTDTAWEYTDGRAVRNNNILQPNQVWTASEWTITSGAITNDMTPGVHGPLPEFQGLENGFVFPGDSLSMMITAVNTVRTDVITLSATALPAGATFSSATGTNTVSSTLNWNSPTAGTYTATFAATGFAGTSTASVTITVSSRARIAGYFHGWSGNTIFKLDNGQFWQQSAAGAKTVSPAPYRPTMTITNYLSYERRMYVTNVTGYVVVAPLTVTESIVTNAFTGLYNGNVYQLADRTIWKQISFENISSNTSSVTAWRWIKNGQQMLRFLDRNDRVIGTCTVEASAPPAGTTVYSKIDGWFRGWQNKRVFVLKNGQFWQQTALDSSSQTLYSPAVTITNWLQTGNWRIGVAGLPGYVSVQQLTNVTRTAINGTFYGFGSRQIFGLKNGSWWRQSSSETSTSTRSNPEILIWSESGTDYLEMPDEGLRVAAAALNVQLESTVTNSFTGLHYGNLYRLAGAGDWLQLSFENIRTNVTNPSVMLWMEGAQTGLLVRDSRDTPIGTCIVADPITDSDGDGINNLREVIAGSNPLDSASVFLTSVLCPPLSGPVLRWNAVEGRLYTIEWTPSLTQPFQALETGIAWPQNSWTDTLHAAETRRFYRIGVRLAD